VAGTVVADPGTLEDAATGRVEQRLGGLSSIGWAAPHGARRHRRLRYPRQDLIEAFNALNHSSFGPPARGISIRAARIAPARSEREQLVGGLQRREASPVKCRQTCTMDC
jgi:hypothetical protein